MDVGKPTATKSKTGVVPYLNTSHPVICGFSPPVRIGIALPATVCHSLPQSAFTFTPSYSMLMSAVLDKSKGLFGCCLALLA